MTVLLTWVGEEEWKYLPNKYDRDMIWCPPTTSKELKREIETEDIM